MFVLCPLSLSVAIATSYLIRDDQWHVYKVFAQEPHLHFVPAKNFANENVIASVVSQIGGPAPKSSGLFNDGAVRIQQTGDQGRRLFPTSGRTFNSGKL